MRKTSITLALCGWVLVAAFALKVAHAEHNSQKGSIEVVRQIDIKGLSAKRPMGDFSKPRIVLSALELAQAIPDQAWQDKISKQVDFTKEQLLYFSWTGSGGDKLSSKVENDKKVPAVVFQFLAGS
jgi:hypothetical protein